MHPWRKAGGILAGVQAEPSGLELIGGPDAREPIMIVDYDERWPDRFEEVAAVIRRALGGSGNVHHIGSTSVPGLAAKPVLDILLVVSELANEGAYLPLLQGAGFVLRAREPGHRLLRTRDRDVHLHVYQDGADDIDAYLELRDWLRSCRDDRELYAATKRQLAQRDWPTMNDYAMAKSHVVADILKRARTAGPG